MNILILTCVYPRDDAFKTTSATKVIHYFAKEWQDRGHNVFVVHTSSKLLKITYMLPQKIKDYLKAKTGNEFPDINITKKKRYNFEGIKVYRRPVFKLIPRSLPSEKEVENSAKDIVDVLKQEEFIPDIIVGHWAVPQLQVIHELKKYYASSRTSIVFHDDYYAKKYNNDLKDIIKSFDAIGSRSKTISQSLYRCIPLDKCPYVCYSGVPDDYINKSHFQKEKFTSHIKNFIYVGELISRKYCDVVISSLAKCRIQDWHLDIIGIGNEKTRFEELAHSLKVEKHITFHGRVSREQVFELMKKAQCFIMPSKNEAFGLVYLEAMVASCITIGSFKEGIDGIIIDDKNGFLVNAGDGESLSKKLEQLKDKPLEEVMKIAENGYNTAIQFTDSEVANKYLKDILDW